MLTIDDFKEERQCTYKGELYSVRDNGAVFRHSKDGARKRRDDDVWTFGQYNSQNGYAHIGKERVHRIVACAFIGEPPTPQHVVDHIDTNRRNNRPENLRWLTRLENVLLNPITIAKIECICGSIEAFIENPAILHGYEAVNPNFVWMRAVTAEEAKIAYQNLSQWAKERPQHRGGLLGEWIYEPTKRGNYYEASDRKKPTTATALGGKSSREEGIPSTPQSVSSHSPEGRAAQPLVTKTRLDDWDALYESFLAPQPPTLPIREGDYGSLNKDKAPNEDKLYNQPSTSIDSSKSKYEIEDKPTQSLTPNAVQVDWRTPSEFPLCPQAPTNPIEDYYSNLISGEVFCKNELYASVVWEAALVDEGKAILLMTKSAKPTIKNWALAKITYVGGVYRHYGLGSFFKEDGALKYYTLGQGKEWTGPTPFDDYVM